MTQVVDCILFDLDGTLVDSSAIVRRVMKRWCQKHGISLQAVLRVYGGRTTEDTVALVAPQLCAKSESAAIEAEERENLDGLMPVKGAREFLNSLNAIQWAVVTSSSLATASHKLHACQLPVPDVLITAESVTQGKPHPEPFLKAADTFGVKPSDCLVFEDADNGVHSALAAGCTVVVIGNTCRIKHERIVGQITSFADISMTTSGELRVAGRMISSFRPEVPILESFRERIKQ